MELRAFDRTHALDRMEGAAFDLLVVGGGITGAGVALDAAARGLRCALVERRDFASGTSSKSSKLVHGGLRYLQQREVGLVYENLAERQRLLDNAPHLVTPLPFLIPLFGKGGVVDATVARAYSSALWAYDLTGGLRIGRRHRRIGAEEALAHLPTLRTDRLVAGFLYYDAAADDARLTLTLARTAVMRGALAANYAPATALLKDGSGRIRGARVEAEDPVTGARHELEVRADAVVNATGVWADELRSLDDGLHRRSIRPAKGIHVTVRREKLPCDIAVVLPVPGDRRQILVIPWGEEVYVGTTDTDYEGPLDDPVCTSADVDYLLAAVNAFVTEPLSPSDVVGRWAGLRPLLAADAHGASPDVRTADLSRRHQVEVSPSGLVSVTGGKLTTYRRMAADTVDAAASLLGRGARRSPTRKLPLLGGGPPLSAEAARRLGVGEETLAHLTSRYGDEAGDVAALVGDDPDLARPLVAGLPYLAAEAVHAARHEMARSLDDVLSRRTRAALHDAVGTAAAAGTASRLVGAELGWSGEQVESEAASFAGATVRTEARAAGS